MCSEIQKVEEHWTESVKLIKYIIMKLREIFNIALNIFPWVYLIILSIFYPKWIKYKISVHVSLFYDELKIEKIT